MISLDDSPTSQMTLPGLTAEPIFPGGSATAKFDLSFGFSSEPAGGVACSIEYSSDLFDTATIETLAVRLQRFLAVLLADTDTPVRLLDVLVPGEAQLVLAGYNDTGRDLPQTLLPQVFEATAARTPNLPAVAAADCSLSFAQLNERANRLARELIVHGAGPERIVALALPRTSDLLVAVLAVLKSGAAYLPLNPHHPADRLHYTLADADPVLSLTNTALAGRLPADHPVLLLDQPATAARIAGHPGSDLSQAERRTALHPDHPAYVIYTSGSTGQPKGVVVHHRSLANLLHTHEHTLIRPHLDPARPTRVALIAEVTFDTSLDSLCMLCVGHELHLIDEQTRLDSAALTSYIIEQQLDFLDLTPSHLSHLLTEGLLQPDHHTPRPAHGRR